MVQKLVSGISAHLHPKEVFLLEKLSQVELTRYRGLEALCLDSTLMMHSVIPLGLSHNRRTHPFCRLSSLSAKCGLLIQKMCYSVLTEMDKTE